jgi:uncharacterized repeat protein (TIGR02543 family)
MVKIRLSAHRLGRLLAAFSRLAALVIPAIALQSPAAAQMYTDLCDNHAYGWYIPGAPPRIYPYDLVVYELTKNVKMTMNGKVTTKKVGTGYYVVAGTLGGVPYESSPTDAGTAFQFGNGLCDSLAKGVIPTGNSQSELSRAGNAVPATTPVGQASDVGLIVADLNGDGIPDTVQLSSFLGAATVTLFAADQTVLSTSSFQIGATSVYGLPGDFNGDGKQDLAIASGDDGTGTGSVWILLGNGDGTFQAAKKSAVSGNPFNIAIGDFNGDGKLDVAVTDDKLGLVVWVLLGNGDGTLQSSVSYASGGTLPDSILAADFNNDGKLDLAVMNDGANTFAVLLGKGDGTFNPPQISPGGAGGSGYLAYADFNHDGNLDLAIAYSLTNSISMLMGNGDGTFQPATNYVTGGDPDSLAVIPLDDGTFALLTLDIVSGEMIVSSTSSGGTLLMPPIYTIGGMPAAIAAADLNGDRIPDVVFYDSASSAVNVMLTASNFALSAPVTYPLQNAGGYTAIQALAIGDLNGDGHPDVMIANSQATAGSVSVLLGSASGTLGTEHDYASGSYPSGVVLADFNGDGKLDAAVVNSGNTESATDTGNISVLIGNGDGSFKTPASYSAGSQRPLSLVAADFNGDGKPDLAVATEQVLFSDPFVQGNVTILLNNGDGTFKTGSTLAAGPAPFQELAVAAGDVNGDGKIDLAVLDYNQNTSTNNIAIFLGNGDGTFRTGPVTTSMQGELLYLSLSDVNGDGLLDLTASDGYDAAYLLGNGDGTFQSEQHIIFTGPSPNAVASTNFNGDGQPDLVFTDQGGYLVTLANAFPRLAVAPETPVLAPSQTQQFTVTGYFGTSTAVTWALENQDGTPSTAGTISTSGLYTAPTAITTQQTVNVIATSVSSANYTASAAITLSPPVQLTITASPAAGGTVTPANGSSYASGTVVPITATANSGYQFTGWTGPVASASSASTTVTMSAAETVTANFTATAGHPAFFSGEDFLSGIVYYLQFPDSNLFGYYEYLSSSILYHFDMGYEAFIPGSGGSIYFYDFGSGHWWYTSSSLFPYIYDFSLGTFIYYFPSATNPGHYTTDPRYFSNLTTKMIFSM